MEEPLPSPTCDKLLNAALMGGALRLADTRLLSKACNMEWDLAPVLHGWLALQVRAAARRAGGPAARGCCLRLQAGEGRGTPCLRGLPGAAAAAAPETRPSGRGGRGGGGADAARAPHTPTLPGPAWRRRLPSLARSLTTGLPARLQPVAPPA
jgi:hypothetical protein